MEPIDSSPARHRNRAVMWMVLTTLLWGGSFVFNKIGFREIHPVTFLFFRFSLAALIMFFLAFGKLRELNRQTTGKGLLVGAALCAANLSFVFGVFGTSVSRAGFLNNLFVLVIPLLCYVVWREKIRPITAGGIGLAVAGLWSLARGGSGGFSTGDLLSSICAFFIAIHIISVSRILGKEDVRLVTFVQFCLVAAVGGILHAGFAPAVKPFGPTTAAALLYCAIFPTVICFTLQNRWQRYTTPAEAGLIYTLDPIWSMLGGMLILGERLTSAEVAGCGLIFSGVLLPVVVQWMREKGFFAGMRSGRVQGERFMEADDL